MTSLSIHLKLAQLICNRETVPDVVIREVKAELLETVRKTQEIPSTIDPSNVLMRINVASRTHIYFLIIGDIEYSLKWGINTPFEYMSKHQYVPAPSFEETFKIVDGYLDENDKLYDLYMLLDTSTSRVTEATLRKYYNSNPMIPF